MAYKTQPATGGEWHIYPDGRRVFVKQDPWKQWGAGMGALGQQGIGYNAQTGQYTQNVPPAAPGQLGEDAASIAARAQAQFQRTQSIGQLDTQGGYDKQDLEQALGRMRTQRTADEQGTKTNANKQGLFYSGILGKRLDDLATAYAQREGDQQTAYQRRDAARIAARSALEAGAPLEDAAITAALAERRLASDTAAADTGSLVRQPSVIPMPRVARAAQPAAMPRPKAPAKVGGWAKKLPQYTRAVRRTR